ncbi:hypothetical protein FQZ97_633310 [compost metagenome]
MLSRLRRLALFSSSPNRNSRDLVSTCPPSGFPRQWRHPQHFPACYHLSRFRGTDSAIERPTKRSDALFT